MKSFFLLVLLWCSRLPASVYAAEDGWLVVEAILQRAGEKSGKTISFFYPRLENQKIKGGPSVACASSIGSRITFTRVRSGLAAIEGVIAARSDEAEMVVSKLLAEGLLVTKPHQASKEKQPGITSIHFTGRGSPENLVWAFSPALSVTETPMGPAGFPDSDCNKLLKVKGTQ